MYNIRIDNPSELTVKELVKLLKTFNQEASIAVQDNLICGIEGDDRDVRLSAIKIVVG